MFFFIREGRYVTAVNKFWFWISVVAGLLGVGMSFTLLQRAGQIPLGIIMALLFIGCVIFDCMFLIKGKRSIGITACGYGIAATIIPFILQCINLQSDSYIPMAGCSVLTVISNIWALVGSKKFSQEWDENVKTCLTLKGKNSRIPMAALYVLACVGIVLALVAVISGKLPVYP